MREASHIASLRSRMNEVLQSLGAPTLGYTDPVLTNPPVVIRAVHLQQLQERAQ